MAVNAKHPEYSKNLIKWQLMRDALAGEVA